MPSVVCVLEADKSVTSVCFERLGLFQKTLLSNDLAADNLTKFLEDILNKKGESKFRKNLIKLTVSFSDVKSLGMFFTKRLLNWRLGKLELPGIIPRSAALLNSVTSSFWPSTEVPSIYMFVKVCLVLPFGRLWSPRQRSGTKHSRILGIGGPRRSSNEHSQSGQTVRTYREGPCASSVCQILLQRYCSSASYPCAFPYQRVARGRSSHVFQGT